jgi:hypothetical protein
MHISREQEGNLQRQALSSRRGRDYAAEQGDHQQDQSSAKDVETVCNAASA